MTMVTMKKTAWCSASHQDTEYAVHVHQDTAARVQHSVHFDSLETTFDALTMMMPFSLSLSLLSVHTHTALFSQSRITYSAHSPLDSCIYLVIVYRNAFLLSLALSLSRSRSRSRSLVSKRPTQITFKSTSLLSVHTHTAASPLLTMLIHTHDVSN